MSPEQKITQAIASIEGTPLEIGAEVFSKFTLPALQAIAKQPNATLDDFVLFYAGHIQACLGAMTADFGSKERAAEIAQLMVDTFKTMDLPMPSASKH